jgi:hypothetical protein
MVEKIPTEIINMILFTNQKEVDRAIKAAVDKYNEIHSCHTAIEHKRNRHRQSPTKAPRKLRRHS